MKPEQLIPGVMAHIQKALHDVAEQQIQDAVKEFEAKARRANPARGTPSTTTNRK